MGTRILLLGATGAVGRACLDILAADPDIVVTVAGRDPRRLHAVCTRPTVRSAPAGLDLAQLPRHGMYLMRLAAESEVVVNCAGPSHRYSRAVAVMSMLCGAAYVDPGLDRAAIEHLSDLRPHDGVAVVQAGLQPGLSGLVLRVLAERLGGQVDRMSAWCGGLQPLTTASVLEYLADAAPGARSASTVVHDGVRVRRRPGTAGRPPAGTFPDTVHVHDHLDDETSDVAACFGAKDVEWANITDGTRTERLVRRLRAGESTEVDPTSIEAVRTAARLDLFGRTPYFTLHAHARHGERRAELTLSTPDSYAITGATAAWAARAALDLPPGVHALWRVPTAATLLDELPITVPGTTVRTEAVTDPEEGAV